jgi:acetyl-CoA carboxylase biotin carboxyl carrier protein
MPMADERLDVIRHALRVACEHGYTEVELDFDDTQFEAKLARVGACIEVPVSSTTVDAVETSEPGLIEITAPVVGFVKDNGGPLTVGQRVEKGDTVAVVAALGLANDVEAPESGEIVEVLVQDGQPVEYGQPLARVRPA